MNTLSLRAKLLLLGGSATLLPLIIVVLVNLQQGRRIEETIGDELKAHAYDNLHSRLGAVFEEIELARKLLNEKTNASLKVAAGILEETGTPRLAESRQIEWEVVDQKAGTTTRMASGREPGRATGSQRRNFRRAGVRGEPVLHDPL